MVVMINDVPCLINDMGDLKHHLSQFVNVDVDKLIQEAGLVEKSSKDELAGLSDELRDLSDELEDVEDLLKERSDLLHDIRCIALNGMDIKDYENALEDILIQTDEL